MCKTTHLLGALLAAGLTSGSALATTYTVTTTADDGSGSLRQRSAQATDGDLIVFDASLDGRTITLLSPIVIDDDAEIQGNGPQATRIAPSGAGFILKSGVGVMRFSDLAILSATAASGAAIRIDAGRVEVVNCAFGDNRATGNLASEGGGAIANFGGYLYVKDCEFRDNLARGVNGSGGAILNGPDGALEVIDTRFFGNVANRAGGAIEDASGASSAVTLSGVEFFSNSAETSPGNGGAVHLTGAGDISVTGGSAVGNTAFAEGGAFWNGAGEMRLSGVEIRANRAFGDDADQGGGGIYNNGGRVVVTGETRIRANVATGASGSGGGILNAEGGSLELYGTVLDSNRASRAGGGIEDISGAATEVRLFDVRLVGNATGDAPGNGGGLHVTGDGDVTVSGGAVRGNTAAAEGGGLWNGTGAMIVLDVDVIGNVASGDAADQGGGGIFNAGGLVEGQNRSEISGNRADGASGSGGGILNDAGGTLRVVKSVVKDNAASRAGGGIEDNSGAGTELVLYEVTLRDNATGSAPGNGGGLHITGPGDAKIQRSLVLFNTAASEGGGLWNGTGRMYVDNTTVDDNRASGDDATNGGGGIFNAGGELVLVQVSIGDNVADGVSGSGGGIFNDAGGRLSVYDGAVNGNVANRAGGGLEDNSGAGTRVELFGLVMEGNVAGPDTASANPGNGGAIHVTGPGDIKIAGGAYVRNVAASEGGGLWNGTGAMTLSDVSVAENVAAGDAADNGGGGVFNAGGALVVRGKTRVSRNAATGASGSGGGIFNATGGTLEVKDAFIVGNTASRAGGGIEEASDTDGAVVLIDVTLNGNATGDAPGNGGGLHVTGTGDVYIKDSQVVGNTAASEGGGLWNGGGGMVLDFVDVRENTASGRLASNGGGGLFNLVGSLLIRDSEILDNAADGANGSGGGVLNDAGANLRIERTRIAGNSASRAGGGIEDNSGANTTVELEFVDLLDNVTGPAPGNGGGFHITGSGNANLTGGLVAGNTAASEGGGLWNGAGVMNLHQVTVRDNVADGEEASNGGGGVFNNGGTVTLRRVTVSGNASTGAAAIGGGLHNGGGGTALLRWSTISGNTSANNAGGIANGGTLRLTGVTVAANTAAAMGGGIGNAPSAVTATLRSSLVADNIAPDRGPDLDLAGGAYVSAGHNLIENPTAGAFPAVATDLVGVDPQLGPLADNGGQTRTHKLGCQSPAIGQGDPELNGSDDQRNRNTVGTRDIGSYERQDGCASTGGGGELVADGAGAGFEVFPTVSTDGHVSVRALDDASGAEHTYRLLDARGQVLQVVQTGSDLTDVSFAGYAPGTYYVQRVDGTGTETQAVIVR